LFAFGTPSLLNYRQSNVPVPTKVEDPMNNTKFFLTRIIATLVCVTLAIIVSLQLQPIQPSIAPLPVYLNKTAPKTPDARTPEVTPRRPRPRLIAITATWCTPCHQAKPTIDKIESAGISVTRYDVDTPEGRTIINKYGQSSVPTFVVVEPDGTEHEPTHEIAKVEAYFQPFLTEKQ
jgi:thiol-disulfide isomerase/thioredoxin